MRFTAWLIFLQTVAGSTFGSISAVVPAQAGSGVIAGSVVDGRGAPVAHVTVHVIGPPMRTPDGRTVEMTRSMPTDEGGRFRIDHLPAQAYVVAVAPPLAFRPQRPGMPNPSPADDQPVDVLTYFPGVIDRAQAQSVAVTADGEQTIFVEVQRVMPVHIRGTVVSPSGRSTSGVPLQLQRTIGSSGSSSMVGYVQADGSFDLAVPPGTYTLAANVSSAPGTEFAVADLKVNSAANDGVALVLSPGGTVRGQIVFDGPSPGPAPLGASLFLAAAPGGPLMGRPLGQVPVADDWTFEAKGLYGAFRFSAPNGLSMQYRPARVDFDGRNIGNNIVEIRDGEHQVVIHLAPVPPRQTR
jgi:hypothetical protein